MQNKKIIKGANLRFSGSCGHRRFQIGCVFVEYDLFNTRTFIQNCIYMNCRMTEFFYQFLETGTSDRCLICDVQRLRFLGFILYPLSFFLYSPFKHFLFRRSSTK